MFIWLSGKSEQKAQESGQKFNIWEHTIETFS
jgi:hypothetical protein